MVSDQGVTGVGNVVIVPGAGVTVPLLTTEVHRAVDAGAGLVKVCRADSWRLESRYGEVTQAEL